MTASKHSSLFWSKNCPNIHFSQSFVTEKTLVNSIYHLHDTSQDGRIRGKTQISMTTSRKIHTQPTAVGTVQKPTPEADDSMPSTALSSWPTSKSDGPGSPNCRLLLGKYMYLHVRANTSINLCKLSFGTALRTFEFKASSKNLPLNNNEILPMMWPDSRWIVNNNHCRLHAQNPVKILAFV